MKNPINEFSTPIEQDTFVMNIPFRSISVLEVWAASRNSNDENNLLYLRCNLYPFDLSAEGSINISFKHFEDNFEDRAAWPWKVGSDVLDDQDKYYPCKIYLDGRIVGDNNLDWNYHRNVRCSVKAGDSLTKPDTIIQIYGF